MLNVNELRLYIENTGLKRKFISKKISISEAKLSQILSGKRKCSIEEYVKLCNFLVVPFDTFITRTM